MAATAGGAVVGDGTQKLEAPVAGTFIATRTWDGSVEPDAQADPSDAAIPIRFI